VAIAHDYLTQRGGAERVVLAMLRAFPEAEVHTLLYDPDGTFPDFRDVHVVTSPLNRLGPLRRDHRLALPLLAPAASRLRVDADVTLVSTSGWAHGFDIRGRSLVYCYNPARWLYQADDYLGDGGARSAKALALRLLAPGLRRWDQRAARSRDRYLAISTAVRDRIRATYGIEADVLFPPTTVLPSGAQQPVGPFGEGFYLLVSRLLPYKNVDKAIDAFRDLPDQRLLVIGRGPEEERLRRGLPANVAILSGVTDDELRWAYAHCVALVAPSLEDYGLTPLEAGAFGKPTLALRDGGYLDTVAEQVTGLFFDRPEAGDIARSVLANRAARWDAEAIVRHGGRFDEETFRDAITTAVAVLGAGDASSGSA
jgi:glycosyltransferase involved in cell wall biosynthesis